MEENKAALSPAALKQALTEGDKDENQISITEIINMMLAFWWLIALLAVLIGGASISKAKISHVLLGTFLFQGLLAVALPVINKFLPESNLSDVLRIIISYGIILYALSKTKGGRGSEQ